MNTVMYQPLPPSIDTAKTAKQLKYYCKLHNVRAKDLQKFFGFENPQSVYNWLSGKNLPSTDNLLALSHLFHTSINDLLVTSDMEVSFRCA